MKSNLLNNDAGIDEMEIKMWEALNYLAFVDMYDTDDIDQPHKSFLRSASDYQLDKLNYLFLNGKGFPCSYLFTFRGNLLNKNKNYFLDVRCFSVVTTDIESNIIYIYIYFLFPETHMEHL